MSIKVFIPYSHEGEHISCYEVETKEVYLYTIEHWKHMGGEMYERRITREPRGQSYEQWCTQGIEHSQEQKDEDILVYHRKISVEGQLLEFGTLEEFIKFMAEYGPIIEVETDRYFLSDGTSLIGISGYYD